MGDGYAVLPEAKEIFAPISGMITSIFPTKHALGIETDNGLEVLVHMGINTVDLQGEPFTLYVKQAQRVERGQLLAVVDLAMLEKAGKQTDMIVVFTNSEKVESLTIEKRAMVEANEVIGQVQSL